MADEKQPGMTKDRLTMDDPDTFRIVVLSDGTNTSAEILQRGDQGNWFRLGYGGARRRKGDRRNRDLGARLATSRALRDAADRIDEYTKAQDEL